jgi:single-strand DNA-binding protein
MASNTITIVGNLTRDPELRYTPSGQSNTRFGVAVNRRWQDRSSGEWQEATSFFDVVCWRELAENVSESLGKGSRVLVTRLEQRTWETKEGDKRNVVEIIADEVGASLRFATAKVERNERKGGGDFAPGGGSGGGGDGSGGGGGGGRPTPEPAQSYDQYGEEPF